jgi:hypothetical protein
VSRLLAVLVLLATTGPDAGPPTKPGDEHYTQVRKDVLAAMNAADINLPKCESALASAQKDLQTAAQVMTELKAAADELARQKATLEAALTGAAQAQTPTWLTALEDVDAPVACAGCWALGTAQCVGLAWVFNQSEFKR